MSKKRIHVVPHNGSWATRGENQSRVSTTHDTQSDAIDVARRRAKFRVLSNQWNYQVDLLHRQYTQANHTHLCQDGNLCPVVVAKHYQGIDVKTLLNQIQFFVIPITIEWISLTC